jgi:hypothetical protein
VRMVYSRVIRVGVWYVQWLTVVPCVMDDMTCQ